MSGGEISVGARRYALGLLFAAYVVNYVDRQVVIILQDAIKQDLGLSDTQLGLMTGLAFALFFAVMGVPVARLADRYSRKGIIAVCMTLWSAMTALCGTAGSFATLLLFRIGVGVGEAGLTPAAHSMISDYYEPRRRTSAIAIYSAAGTAGLMVGYLAGGWINQYFGWRVAIMMVGLPGVALALLIWATLKEPVRGRFDAPVAAADAEEASKAGLLTLLKNPAFRCIALACALHTFVTFGQGNFTPPFFGRVHGMSSLQIGTWLAVLAAGPGLIGMIGMGYVADWWGRRRPEGRLEFAALSVVCIMPLEIGGFLSPNPHVALAFLGGCFIFAGACLAPSYATAHELVPARLRASASALLLLAINLLGLGIGPWVAGALSDMFAGMGMGVQSLRYALVAIVLAQAGSVALFVRAIWHVRRMKALQSSPS